ncbi:2-hydroxy-acid oxidase [Roseovarius indicus]|uniref:D-lactate dehydrogenase (cytochrome) n=2 Tax=Roseovarius indicus TaxID=540747 RepID=A0A0T5PDK9_9RHOB|nr:2-hydroxy-acid oxidase [Roseovarius indicus]
MGEMRRIETALPELQALLGERLVTSEADRALHGQNETYYPVTPPDAVAYPENTEEVSAILRLCNRHAVPVTAYGAASSLEGQHLAIQGGISLDMSRMGAVLAVNAEDLNAVVQPGITRKRLNEELRATGLFFPVDPGADASIGGMAATRASGTTAVRYGTMRENILALEAVMADGTVIRTGSRARKSSTGYDLTHLLVGSEGTLGIITELTLRLQGIPEAISAATCRFPSVEDAVNCVILTIQSGLPMARIELLDEMMVRGFNRYSQADLPEEPHLFLEFHGSPAAVAEQRDAFGEIATEFGADGWKTADTTEERNALWEMRHKAHYASAAFGKGGHIWPTDVCVPISHLAEAVLQAQRDAKRLGLTATIVGHVGDGNFHAGLSVDPGDADEMARAEEFTQALAETALRLGGTVSGEHGIGLGKQKYMTAEHGAALAYMRAIKAGFDPNNILNPGKLLPPGNREISDGS